MAIDHRLGNKVVKNARREEASGTRVDPYPYIGIVKNNLDPTRSGRLQVYIPDLGGPEDDPKNWRTVSYASPFMGYTPQTATSTERPSLENKFQTVSHTYGMWFIPPDIGIQVIVLFMAGDPLRGYWLACVNPNLSHYMVPGLAGTKNIDKTSLPGGGKNIKDGEILPVVEFNQYTKDFTNQAFYNNNKPVHTFQWDILKKQGLDKDYIRGPLSSSSQRESPSFVFGISTPGRPVDDPADDPNYIANLRAGKLDKKYELVKTRKGGHTFIMDDGATMGEDQLVRLRTAKGHQVLLHDTNETLYIAHMTGKSWIELAKDGSILIYAKDGFALRTEGSINMKADSDFNLDVGGKINMRAGTSLNLETPKIEFLAEDKFRVTAKAGTEFKTGTYKIDASGKISVKGDGTLVLQASSILQNSGGGDQLQEVKKLQTVQLPDTVPSGTSWTPKPNAQQTIVRVAPTHEPYLRGTTGRIFTPESPGIQPRAYTGSVDATKTASSAGVQNGATFKDLRNQPAAKETVGVLSTDQTTAFLAQMGKGQTYSSTGTDGSLGKYQFDFKALQQAGYIKSTVTSNADLTNPNSWIGKNGMANIENFLASAGEQESVMSAVSKLNYTAMLASGAITSEQSPEDVAGMMAVAHKLGVDAAKSFREGSLNAAEIFNQGKYAVGVMAPKLPGINAG